MLKIVISPVTTSYVQHVYPMNRSHQPKLILQLIIYIIVGAYVINVCCVHNVLLWEGFERQLRLMSFMQRRPQVNYLQGYHYIIYTNSDFTL